MKVIDGYGEGPKNEVIDFTEKNLRVKFPQEFIDCIKQCDEGVLENTLFDIINPDTGNTEVCSVGRFLSFNPSNEFNILRAYFILPDFAQKKLIPLSATGDNDYICFDYSIDGFEDKNPPVIYYFRANPEGQDVADIAITFKEFLKKLKPDPNVDLETE